MTDGDPKEAHTLLDKVKPADPETFDPSIMEQTRDWIDDNVKSPTSRFYRLE